MRVPQPIDSPITAPTPQLTPVQLTWAKVLGRALGQKWLTEVRQRHEDARLAAPLAMPDDSQAQSPEP
jgi:hypothetical protein